MLSSLVTVDGKKTQISENEKKELRGKEENSKIHRTITP